MAKLVVVMPDGSTVDVPLDRERITIGRRPDNDVCLPYPPVSGEHAAVVTILADSFLEDLGSTNGTLVNGKPIAKHFLRDHDQIDIGKQLLVYLVNDGERYEPPSRALQPFKMGQLTERVDRVPAPIVTRDPMHVEPHASKDMDALADELDKGISGMQVSAEIDSMSASLEPQPVRAMPPLHVVNARSAGVASQPVHAPSAPDPELTQSVSMPSIKVLTGPNAGRSVPLVKEETTVGRVGVAVAAVRKLPDGFMLVPLEPKTTARVNGKPVADGGTPLRAGDEIEIAGAKLQLVVPRA